MTYINIPSSSSANYQDPVATSADLPLIASIGDVRLVLDTGELNYYNGTSWVAIASGGGGGTWGTITGTLSSQTDLQNALDAKADVSELRPYKPEFFTLSAGEISSKSVELTEAPNTPAETRLIPINGIEQEYGLCFTVSGTTLSWDSLGLDGVLEVNDKIIVIYN